MALLAGSATPACASALHYSRARAPHPTKKEDAFGVGKCSNVKALNVRSHGSALACRNACGATIICFLAKRPVPPRRQPQHLSIFTSLGARKRLLNARQASQVTDLGGLQVKICRQCTLCQGRPYVANQIPTTPCSVQTNVKIPVPIRTR